MNVSNLYSTGATHQRCSVCARFVKEAERGGGVSLPLSPWYVRDLSLSMRTK